MGETATLRSEDRTGLLVAVILHALLVAVLALQWSAPPPPVSQRMTVSLASEVALEASAPDPVPESRAAIAPTLADSPEPAPAETRAETPPPPPTPTTRQAAREPAPSRERSRPDRQPARETPRQPAREEPAGGSRIGENFLEGSGSSTTTDETRIPASQIGASAKASIIQAIVRQIRPHWTAPSGADAELLVTELAFDLNEDGSLKGRPRVLRQSGVTDANRAQQALHAERAIRAVQLAAPFDLPDEYYNAWKSIRGARFDRNLSR
ncbi:energy transducer TonB [Erythrobacter sp.]|uniref:energy transducer TonB n=1 Tax=Erythrobacter sp. TaxID=1042 RepID=UPI001425E210|nr:energy transducer TonB [Erythrobacter sp.]QIQ85336.1 MAG: energy transducer TonB [Erythrobacter sp.]